MERASRVIRRSGVRLKSLSGGHSDLNLVISELRDVRLALKSFLTAQNTVAQDMLIWAQADENRVIQDVMLQLGELNSFWTDIQKEFLEHLKAFKHQFDLILEVEKQADQSKAHLALCEQKELKIKKELKRASKKSTMEEINNLEMKLAQAERAKDLAQFETIEKVQENEAIKMIRIKDGLLKLSDAYIELANKCAIVFEAQREIAYHIPDVHDTALHEIKYTGSGATKQAVLKAKSRVQQYHCYQYRLIPHCPSVEEPPPPYTPGYYDPTTGQPYSEDVANQGAIWQRQQAAAPSCPPERGHPPYHHPPSSDSVHIPSWQGAFDSGGEEDDLAAAMGAAKI